MNFRYHVNSVYTHEDIDEYICDFHITVTNWKLVHKIKKHEVPFLPYNLQKCGVCWRSNINFKNIYVFNCNHIFCIDCSQKCMNSNRKCPYCRNYITDYYVHKPIFKIQIYNENKQIYRDKQKKYKKKYYDTKHIYIYKKLHNINKSRDVS